MSNLDKVESFDKAKIVEDLDRITENVEESLDKREMMEARNQRDMANVARNADRDTAMAMAEALAKKYPDVLFDALSNRTLALEEIVESVKVQIKNI